MKVKLYTLGCKVNQYETEELTELLLKNGYTVTLRDEEADIFLVNSCTVTAERPAKRYTGSSAPSRTARWCLRDVCRRPSPKWPRR